MTHPSTMSREQFFRSLQSSREAVLLLDYDGTLAPFHVDPQRALPYPGVTALLVDIMRAGRTRVVFVSGRRAQELVFLLGIFPPPEIWGCHGLQHLRPDGTEQVVAPDPAAAQALCDAAAWLHSNDLRDLAELKPGAVAVHWRDQPPSAVEALRRDVLAEWNPIARRAGLKLEDFDGGLEMRLSDRDKGDVVRSIVQQTPARTPIAFLGNDAPDEDAFRALNGTGLSVLVSPKSRTTAADLWIRPPDELLQFLAEWFAARQTRPPFPSPNGHPDLPPGWAKPEIKP